MRDHDILATVLALMVGVLFFFVLVPYITISAISTIFGITLVHGFWQYASVVWFVLLFTLRLSFRKKKD